MKQRHRKLLEQRKNERKEKNMAQRKDKRKQNILEDKNKT